MKTNSWSLSHVEIENFKAIGDAALKVEPGFTVITGPNGCGKSCFLESIGFGLGASSAELRVSTLAELCGNDRPGQQVRVILKFTNGRTVMSVGSAVVDRTRLYLVGNAKVTKIKFIQTLTETLGFSKDSISWNISQRAVQDIAKASPKKLFDTLCFVAGTHSVLEARNLANQQIVQSELQLVSVISVIKKLEEGIESERRILQLMNDKDEVEGALKEASREKELGEKIYEVSRKFISLIAAVVITRKLTAINNEEKELADRLRCRLNLYREFEEDSGLDVEGESDFLSSPHKQERDTRNLRKGEIKKNVDLQKCRSANVIAGEAVSDVQSSIAQKSKVTAQLRGESTEQIQLIFDTNRRLKRSILDAAARDEEYSVMNEVTIPVLCMRISALELEMHSAITNSGVAVIIAQKTKQLRSATEITKHSESLLMAMTARASQEQSKETAFEGKLERAKSNRDDLAMEAKTLQTNTERNRCEELRNGPVDNDQKSRARCVSATDVLLMQQEVQVLQGQVRSLAQSLRLPSILDADGVSRASDGDFGFLADILYFPCGDRDMSTATSSSSSGRNSSSSRSNDHSQYMVALDVILGSKLCVRVCRDGAAAEAIMVAQNRTLGAVRASRIWPVDLLTATPTRSKPFLDILEKYRDIAIDPAALVRISHPGESRSHDSAGGGGGGGGGGSEALSATECSSMQRVLFKAIESWIIVQDDEAAARIIQDKALSRHISGVVTVDGNKHTLGSLTVGFGGRRPGSRDNRYPDVQVALQIKYRLLKIDLESMQRQVSEFDQKRRDEEQRTRQSTRMADLGALIESSEREVEEMEGALSVQAERATVAHRELSAVRSKFQEAEEHRNRVRAEMAELSNSSDEEKIKLSKCQAEKTLGALVEKRNALEKKASEHVVLQMEVKAEAARLQDTVSGAQDALKGLAEQITERERELRDLNGYLSRLEGTARECEGRLNECEQMRLQEEEEEAALSEEIEAKREAIALQSRKLIANFQKYDQSALAERYGIESKRDTKGSGDTSSSKVIKPSAAVEGMRGGLENSIKLDKDSAEKEVAAMVGQEQLACLEENEEKYLREAREVVVKRRERVTQLVFEAARLKAALSAMMKGSGIKEGTRSLSSAPDSASDNDNGDDSDNDNDSDSSDGESRTAQKNKKNKKKKGRGVRGERQQQQQQQQRSEGKMREAIHRKTSLLNVVKQKYEQIQLSIAALAEGAKGVDGATAELHGTTYKALRERCQRYFSDLVPGKRLDLVPLHSSGNLERGLKFVLMSERDADGEGDSEEGEAMSVESIGGASGSEEEEEEEDSKARRDRRQRKEGISPAGKRHIKSTEELSGGQRALLGLSFVFACALHKTSPLYLLDEVDAALDEANQKIAGAVIAKIFQRSQVVCVSHHSCFQEQATSCIPVFMRDGRSVIGAGCTVAVLNQQHRRVRAGRSDEDSEQAPTATLFYLQMIQAGQRSH